MTLTSTNGHFSTVEDIEEYLTTKGAADVINIWNNLQESLDTVAERIQFFNRIAAKRGFLV